MRRRASALIAVAFVTLAAASARGEPGGTALSDAPCRGCQTFAPTRDASPRPLLIALHGDDAGAAKLFRALLPAAERAQVILVSLRCPTELGCRTSYWQWYSTSTHDPGWIEAQIAATRARFSVDLTRIYAAGYSGGATYLGWYAPTHPTTFAAVAHIAGGMPWGTRCPACKVPVLFLLGATDPMLEPYTRPLRDYYAACGGHEIVWTTLPGVTHASVIPAVQAGRGTDILTWLLRHRGACGLEPVDADSARPAGEDRDAGAIPSAGGLVDAGPIVDARPVPSAGGIVDARAVADGGSPRDPSRRIEGPAPPKVNPRVDGCACDLVGEDVRPGGGALLLPIALLAARRRRRRRRARYSP